MTAPIPVAEVIADRRFGGKRTARCLCPGCGRTHLHLWPTDASTPLLAPCGAVYVIGGQPFNQPERNPNP